MLNYHIEPVISSFRQNCSIIWDSNGVTGIIDPGGDIDSIISFITLNNLKLEKILLTHGHLDHIAMSGVLSKKLSIPIIGPHRDDFFLIRELKSQCEMYRFPIPEEPVSPTRFLKDGDSIDIGEEVLQVIHCPGHTPGHVVYYHIESLLLFVGDVLFKNSIGRYDFPRSNYNHLLNSIRNKLFILPPATRFIPGHGEMSTLEEERLLNPFVADHFFS